MKELIKRLRHYSPNNNFRICGEAADAIESLSLRNEVLERESTEFYNNWHEERRKNEAALVIFQEMKEICHD